MDQIKEAFQKVKDDIFYLKQNINSLRIEVNNLKNELEDSISSMQKMAMTIEKINENIEKDPILFNSTDPALQHINPTHTSQQTDNPAHNLPLKGLKDQNIVISTGNEGVPTDSQSTDRQTIRHIQHINFKENPLENASKLIDSLDSLKKDIRLKFKRLTEQEILVFSTIYQLEEQGDVDYALISQKLNLSESSIRDYVSRLIKKGIPVEKNKLNNKTILLKISPSLKKIATLPIILQLRDL